MIAPEFRVNCDVIRPAIQDGTTHLGSDTYPDFLAIIPAGLAYCRMLYKNGQPYDFIYLYTNPAFHIETGLGPVTGKFVSEILPGFKDSSSNIFEIYSRVALSGVSENVETYVDAVKRWFSIQAFSPKPEYFVAVFNDITARKRADDNLRDEEYLLAQSQRIAHVGSWHFALTGELTWSEETYRIYGVSPDTFTPSIASLLTLIYPDDRQSMQEWIAASLAGKPIKAMEFRIKTPDGRLRTLCGYGELHYDAANNPLLLIGIVHDVTERIAAENIIQNLIQEQKAIINSDVVGIVKLRNRKVTWVNTAMAKMLGYTPDELIGQSTRIVFPSDSAHVEFGETIYSSMQSGDLFKTEIEQVRKDGSVGWYQICAGRLNNDENDLISSFVDVTDRKRLDLALAQSEARYRKVVEDQTELIARMLVDGTVTFANEIYCRFFGKTASEIIGSKWHPVAYPDDIPFIEAQLLLLTCNSPVVEIENRVYTGNGELRWMHFVNRGVFDADNQLIEIQAVARDITLRKEIEKQLLTSETRLKLVLEVTEKGLWDWDIANGSAYLSPGYYNITGYLPEQITPNFDFFKSTAHPDDLPNGLKTIEAHLQGKTQVSKFDYRLITRSGAIKWVEGIGCVVERDAQGKPLRMVGAISDISGRKYIEQELLDARNHLEKRVAERTEQLRDLSVQATFLEARERQAIARDLHDDIGQILHVAKLKLDTLAKTLEDNASPQIAELNELISDASRRVRSLTSQISPPILHELGLAPALNWLCNDMKGNYGLDIDVRIEDVPMNLSEVQSTILFRAARELLINVAKHADADNVTLNISCCNNQLHLIVEDDGNGINTQKPSGTDNDTGFGLASINERITFLGGSMILESPEQGGFRAILTLPVSLIGKDLRGVIK